MRKRKDTRGRVRKRNDVRGGEEAALSLHAEEEVYLQCKDTEM